MKCGAVIKNDVMKEYILTVVNIHDVKRSS